MDGDSVCQKIQEILGLYEGKRLTAEQALEKIGKELDQWDEYASWGEDR